MNECEICGKECDNKTCSGSCRAKLQRRTRTVETEQAHAQLKDVKVYGRQAVKCSEFGTRPEPLNSTDKPIPLNRGRYISEDDQCYQFDAVGTPFNCSHEYKVEGVVHLAVYETLQDITEANVARQQAS